MSQSNNWQKQATYETKIRSGAVKLNNARRRDPFNVRENIRVGVKKREKS